VKTINYAANKNSARNNNNAARSASETNGSLWKSGCRLTKVGNDFIEKALKRWTSMVSGGSGKRDGRINPTLLMQHFNICF